MALSDKVRVGPRHDGQEGLFAADAIAEGEVLLTYDGPVLDHATRLSIQVDDHVHVEGTAESNAFLNHACDASAYVDWEALCLRARRPLAPGDEITCNYFTTDYDLHSPFVCNCGAPECMGEIRGFKYLPAAGQLALEPFLPPPFLKRKMKRGAHGPTDNP